MKYYLNTTKPDSYRVASLMICWDMKDRSMTFYQRKLKKLQAVLYKNQGQINAVIAVKQYIDTHYAADLNLTRLSKIQLLSKYHLIRLFKKYYGLTPRQYLIDKRIEKSKEHLVEETSFTETCFIVGFTSLGSFSTLFKTKTGKTPTQYQKEQLSRSNLRTDS